jgi:hypothetical protein
MTANILTRVVKRDIGEDTFHIRADARTTFHPISLHLGPAAIVLTRAEALRLSRAFIDAAQFLPK